jgi:type I restriction enzyme M protein
MAADHNSFANLIWQIADLLRGPYRPPQYERVMLPMTVLRRFDCVLATTKAKVVTAHDKHKGGKLRGDALDTTLPNEQMGLIFENLIRRFNELANETAGDHFTPREVIRLMVNLLFIHDDELLATAGTVRKLLDPACGTGGMLAEAQRYLREHNGEARLYAYGQDYNKRAFTTAASDMLMKEVSHVSHGGGGGDNVGFGDIFTDDQFPAETFDYFLSNPPFGVDWKKQQKEVVREHDKRGKDGRFGAGLPRVNDGALLFLQHMWSKRDDVKPKEHKEGSRLAIVFSGSPMFTGGAGSGESEIRRWLLESDWLEAIVALPESMFYNTGIGTYVWIVTNRKEQRRRGKVQLLDARDVWTAGGSEDSKRSLGDKRRHMTGAQIDDVVRLYGRFEEGPRSKLFDNADFGYTRVTIERPLRDAEGTIERDKRGEPKPDSRLRDHENVPLKEDVDAYFEREVRPHVPDAWMDRAKDKVGYEINFNRYFYVFTPPRALAGIDAELKEAEDEIVRLLEQRAIVAHIARETARLDAVRAATERTILLLTERRAALIAAAVTGRLDLDIKESAA